MEYKRTDATLAIELLKKVITLDDKQPHAFFQLGQIHEANSDTPAARSAYEQGITAATRIGDEHARGEISAALEALQD
jgi:predicted TPR repeat methyltransferase